MKLQGIFPALTTPFDYEGSLYRVKVFHNVERLNQLSLAGYVAGGSTAENPLLSVEERLQVWRWVREARAEGRLLVAGTGAESVRETVALSNQAAEIGFDVALVLTPRYYAIMRTPETQALFYRAVADRSKLPVVLYNMPGVTGYDLPVETIASLSEHPNIIGLKDSSGNVEKLAATVKAVKPGFQVLTGSGATFWPALQAGAAGGVLAFASAAPYACITIWEAFRTRQYEAAADWQQRILAATKLVPATYGVPGLKHAMDLNGYYGGPPRLPLVPPGAAARTEIEAAMAEIRS